VDPVGRASAEQAGRALGTSSKWFGKIPRHHRARTEGRHWVDPRKPAGFAGRRPMLAHLSVAPILSTRKEFAPGGPVLFSENDAKAFVYEWFSLIDAGNVEALGDLLVEKGLDVDILGSRMDDSRAFRGFLLAQKDQQRWSAHVPLDLRVDMTNHTEPTVRFLLRFEGELANGALLQLSNLTTWQLRFERAGLRLQRYRMAIL
jgi:hypothetical protein